ncbi:MAG: proliferating cell nuclear antigen (pcna) [Thermoprotei archaeon]|nr:MAG: proliferating cell nuclear antigen (pcna) [Thermoprotei archaeon]
MRLVFPDAREWRYIIESLATIIDEANFIASENGLSLRALDPGRIAMVELDMPREIFEEYEAEGEVKIGVNFDDFNKIIKRAKADNKLVLEVKENKLIVILQGRVERRFTLPLLDIAGQELPEPKLNLTVMAKMLSDTFRDALKDASLMSESIRLKAMEDRLILQAKSDKGELEAVFTLEAGSLLDLEITEPAESSYGLDFLEKIVSKAYRISDIITLQFATNMPLSMTFDIAGGGSLKYLLAPRME